MWLIFGQPADQVYLLKVHHLDRAAYESVCVNFGNVNPSR